MDLKKYLLAVVAVFVVYSGLAFVIHNVLLAADYAPLIGTTLRPFEEFARRMPFLYLSNLVFAAAFCLIYVQGYERAKPWLGQGLRFGLILGTLLAPVAVTEWVAYPVPNAVVLKWVVFGYAQLMVCGLTAAAFYQPKS